MRIAQLESWGTDHHAGHETKLNLLTQVLHRQEALMFLDHDHLPWQLA